MNIIPKYYHQISLRIHFMVAILFFLAINSARCNDSVTLQWDPNPEPDISGYRIYYGEAEGSYTEIVNVDNTVVDNRVTATISNLTEGTEYHFVATAYNVAGLESPYSTPVSTIIGDTPPVLQPILEFSLDEGSGTVAIDSSGQGNNGTLTNGPTYFGDTVDGSAYCLRFDGDNDYIDAGTLDVSGSGLTLAAWFNADSFPGSANDPRIISKASGTSANDHIFMLGTIQSEGAVRLRARLSVDGSTTTLIASSGDLSTGAWHHAAMTYDGAMLRLYLDGIEVGNTALSGSVDTDPSVLVAIGGQPAGSKFFDGLLDDVRILQRGLDASEVAALIDVNQAPVAFDESYSTFTNEALSGVLANVSDPDGDTSLLTFTRVDDVINGTLTLNPNGSFVYTPTTNFSGTDSFTYQVNDGSLSSNIATVTLTVTGVNDTPSSEIAVEGTVFGTIDDVSVSDNSYQAITEISNGTTSVLEHKWIFNVTGGEVVTFYVEAHHSYNEEGDDFIFAYSTDNINYIDMVTVTKTADDDTAQYYTLPSGLSGTVYVRVHDADGTSGHTQLDSIYIDELVIESEVSSTTVPTAALNPVPEDGAVNVDVNVDLSWTAGQGVASHNVFFGTSAALNFWDFQGNQSDTVFEPGTLQANTTYYWFVWEVNSTGTTAGPVWSFTTAPESDAGPKLSTSILTGINHEWQPLLLEETYTSPVIVATVVYGNTSDAPAVVRVRNVPGSNNSFELKVQSPSPSGANLSDYTVHIMVVEEGVYTVAEHGVNLEAIKVLSDGTNWNYNWGSSLLEKIDPSNSYVNPVVLGQVMTENDSNWSVFWSCDGSRKKPANGSSIYVGKHVGQDTLTSRADETLGVIILESGSGTLDGVNYTAGLGADSVLGMDDNPPFSYDISGGLLNVSNESAALVSSAGMNGGDGGWAALFGSSPLSATNLYLVIDEDRMADDERRHTSEKVSYIVFE